MKDLVFEPVRVDEQKEICSLVKESFEGEAYADGKEHELVDRLMGADHFRSGLALKASPRGKMVGFILLTRIVLENQRGQWAGLSMAPVAVLPDFQRRGIGSALIKEAHKKADELGYGSILVIGHKDYYPKFGYRRLDEFGISIPFEVDGAYCFLKTLGKFDEACLGSEAIYPKEFLD